MTTDRSAVPPAPPRHLSAAAKRLWTRLRGDFMLDDEAALLILQSALEAYDRVQEARAIIARDGAVTKDRWGQLKQHPATLVEASARAQMHAALRLLRLSPDMLEDGE
jgi:P27 family predicted phage terminase small subunit